MLSMIIFWVSAAETAYKELGGIPLKFAEELSNSTVAKAYYKELLDSGIITQEEFDQKKSELL